MGLHVATQPPIRRLSLKSSAVCHSPATVKIHSTDTVTSRGNRFTRISIAGPAIRVYQSADANDRRLRYWRSRAALRMNEATTYGWDNIATWLDERVMDVAFICWASTACSVGETTRS